MNLTFAAKLDDAAQAWRVVVRGYRDEPIYLPGFFWLPGDLRDISNAAVQSGSRRSMCDRAGLYWPSKDEATTAARAAALQAQRESR